MYLKSPRRSQPLPPAMVPPAPLKDFLHPDREKVEELSQSLGRTARAHLRQELYSSKERAAGLISPLATLIGSAHSRQEDQLKALHESREALAVLARDARAIVHVGEEAGSSIKPKM